MFFIIRYPFFYVCVQTSNQDVNSFNLLHLSCPKFKTATPMNIPIHENAGIKVCRTMHTIKYFLYVNITAVPINWCIHSLGLHPSQVDGYSCGIVAVQAILFLTYFYSCITFNKKRLSKWRIKKGFLLLQVPYSYYLVTPGQFYSDYAHTNCFFQR